VVREALEDILEGVVLEGREALVLEPECLGLSADSPGLRWDMHICWWWELTSSCASCSRERWRGCSSECAWPIARALYVGISVGMAVSQLLCPARANGCRGASGFV